jgi:SAM-dependent methyltransferase
MDLRRKIMSDYIDALNSHYGARDLISSIFSALENTGEDVNNLTVDSLGPMEELHIGGRIATLELGRLAQLDEKMHVIDVGCGIGGPARALAHHFGCRVTGVDLTEAFCLAARMLTEKIGLSDKVDIRYGNALDLPSADNTFDLAWMQHCSMNIADKRALFKEIARVLKPGGRIALYEIFSGLHPIQYFPVPWSCDASLCFLPDESTVKHDLKTAGFEIVLWDDLTLEIYEFQRRIIERIRKTGWPSLNPGILLGPAFQDMAINLMKNLEEGRLKVIRAVLRLSSSSA